MNEREAYRDLLRCHLRLVSLFITEGRIELEDVGGGKVRLHPAGDDPGSEGLLPAAFVAEVTQGLVDRGFMFFHHRDDDGLALHLCVANARPGSNDDPVAH